MHDELSVVSTGDLSKTQRSGSGMASLAGGEFPRPKREGSGDLSKEGDRLIGTWSKRVVSLLRDKHILDDSLQPHAVRDKWIILDTANSKVPFLFCCFLIDFG